MYFCHVRCYASSSGQKLDSWFEASGAKFGWGSIQLFPRACGGGDRSWWQDMAEAQWGPPLPPPPPPQHSPVPPSGNGTAWNEVLSLHPSPKPQVFQKQARKHFIRLYETLSQTRWTAGFSPNGECCVRAGGGAVPVVRSACQPRHRASGWDQAHPLTGGETKGSVRLRSVACSERCCHTLALGRLGRVAPAQGSGASQLE